MVHYFLYISQLTFLFLTFYGFNKYFENGKIDDFFAGFFLLTISYFCYKMNFWHNRQIGYNIEESSSRDFGHRLNRKYRRKVKRGLQPKFKK